jgi:hypothetical protein
MALSDSPLERGVRITEAKAMALCDSPLERGGGVCYTARITHPSYHAVPSRPLSRGELESIHPYILSISALINSASSFT